MIAALCLSLCSCRGSISDRRPVKIQSEDQTQDTSVSELPLPGETRTVGELYGSYLTMYFGRAPAEILGLPYIKVFHEFGEIEEYYDSTLNDFLYGRLFTLAMASFDDEYLLEHDVMILALDEPSSYVNHTAGPVEITDGGVKISITRHIPQDAPRNETQYHLIFTAPRGSFDGIEDKELDVDVTEIIDQENNSAFDAERFRMYYPEFWNFCYRADSLIDNPQITVDAIDSYGELAYFFDTHRSEFDLDKNFGQYVGTLYNWEVCERYIILATLIPCADKTEPVTTEVFVNNLEIYMSIDANLPEEGKQPEACYLLLTAIERSDLSGVNLEWFNLSIE